MLIAVEAVFWNGCRYFLLQKYPEGSASGMSVGIGSIVIFLSKNR